MNDRMRELLKGKQALRRRFAALPLVEKFRLLDQLRERSLEIAASRSRRPDRPPAQSEADES